LSSGWIDTSGSLLSSGWGQEEEEDPMEKWLRERETQGGLQTVGRDAATPERDSGFLANLIHGAKETSASIELG